MTSQPHEVLQVSTRTDLVHSPWVLMYVLVCKRKPLFRGRTSLSLSALGGEFCMFSSTNKSTSRANSLRDIRPRTLAILFSIRFPMYLCHKSTRSRTHPTRLRADRTSHPKEKNRREASHCSPQTLVQSIPGCTVQTITT